jgi:hypothetical protein
MNPGMLGLPIADIRNDLLSRLVDVGPNKKTKSTIAAAPNRTSWRASKLKGPRIVMGRKKARLRGKNRAYDHAVCATEA